MSQPLPLVGVGVTGQPQPFNLSKLPSCYNLSILRPGKTMPYILTFPYFQSPVVQETLSTCLTSSDSLINLRSPSLQIIHHHTDEYLSIPVF